MKYESRRLKEQRWVIDNIIATVGVDWAWPISHVALGSTIQTIHPMIMMAVNRIKKLSDISREFAGVAARSEEIAREAEAQGHPVTAGEHFYSAAKLYAAAQWPIWEDDTETLLALSRKKNACYGKYIEYAMHDVVSVEVPFEGHFLPGYLHLPRKESERTPCVIFIDGMDGWKEMLVSLYGDKYLERGMAVLAIEGPGQAESSIRKIKVTADNFPRAGKAIVDFLIERSEIDPEKIAIQGVSFGSFWVPHIAACDDRIKCAVGAMVCHEPGMKTIFNEASPTFKARHMWMAGCKDEDAFDKYADSLSLKGVGAKITSPVFIMAGEDDELSPIEHTYAFYDEIQAPKKLMVFQGRKHELPEPMARTAFADWIADRFEGKPMASGIIYVDMMGRETKK